MSMMTRNRRRMMVEATTESLNTVLPKELIIEILYRVDSSNPLQLRCVCKLWKSIILDPEFVQKQLTRSFTDLAILHANVVEDYNCLNSELIMDYPVMPQEDHDDNDVDKDDHAEEEVVEKIEDDDEVDIKEKLKQLLLSQVALLDKFLVVFLFMKGFYEYMKIIDMQMQHVEDRVKCLKGFVRIYLKSAKISSSSS